MIDHTKTLQVGQKQTMRHFREQTFLYNNFTKLHTPSFSYILCTLSFHRNIFTEAKIIAKRKKNNQYVAFNEHHIQNKSFERSLTFIWFLLSNCSLSSLFWIDVRKQSTVVPRFVSKLGLCNVPYTLYGFLEKKM